MLLTSYDVGNRAPMYGLVRVYLGHGSETLDFDGKQDLVTRYFANQMSERNRLALYQEGNIDYVIFTESPPNWTRDELTPVYHVSEVWVFLVPK